MSLKISNKIIGFNKELDFFLKLYNQDNLPNCLMLQGLDGIGKFTLSLHLVSSFLKNNINNFDLKILKNMNLLILKKEDNEKEYKIEDISNRFL